MGLWIVSRGCRQIAHLPCEWCVTSFKLKFNAAFRVNGECVVLGTAVVPVRFIDYGSDNIVRQFVLARVTSGECTPWRIVSKPLIWPPEGPLGGHCNCACRERERNQVNRSAPLLTADLGHPMYKSGCIGSSPR